MDYLKMKKTTVLRKGSLVVAERSRGRWYAGKNSWLTNTDIQVFFLTVAQSCTAAARQK
jgi:hypothetical protein